MLSFQLVCVSHFWFLRALFHPKMTIYFSPSRMSKNTLKRFRIEQLYINQIKDRKLSPFAVLQMLSQRHINSALFCPPLWWHSSAHFSPFLNILEELGKCETPSRLWIHVTWLSSAWCRVNFHFGRMVPVLRIRKSVFFSPQLCSLDVNKNIWHFFAFCMCCI